MLRRSALCLFFNAASDTASVRAKPGMRHWLVDVHSSPYKEQFKEFWATPVPFADRAYGEKPRVGDPVPTRRAATVLVVGRNRHCDADRVSSAVDNDYKVLLVFREARGRYLRDQFVLPSSPVLVEDVHEDWDKVLRRRGASTRWPDQPQRITAMRALLTMANLLLIPKEGGGVAEVEGPPGSQRWYTICSRHPGALRHLIDVLELPMESTLTQLHPFRRIVTPTTETFRFDNLTFVLTIDKLPDVQSTLTCVGERLVWASPAEALARYNSGIMNMPTPTLLALAELHNTMPVYSEVVRALDCRNVPRVMLPTLHYDKDDSQHSNEACDRSKAAVLLLPGDVKHADTSAADRDAQCVRRIVYEKDYPFGMRAVYVQRRATDDEVNMQLLPARPALLEEATELDYMYASVSHGEGHQGPSTRVDAAAAATHDASDATVSTRRCTDDTRDITNDSVDQEDEHMGAATT